MEDQDSGRDVVLGWCPDCRAYTRTNADGLECRFHTLRWNGRAARLAQSPDWANQVRGARERVPGVEEMKESLRAWQESRGRGSDGAA